MHRRRRPGESVSRGAVRWSILSLGALCLACSGSGSDEPDGAGLMERCTENADCASGMCRREAMTIGDGFCAATCETNADCESDDPATTCGITADGARECMRGCPRPGFACVDGVTTACEQVTDDQHCDPCGCADETDMCHPGEGCVARAEVGERCSLDDDCRSNHCGLTGVCRVPVGAPCTSEDCDYCHVSETVEPFCGRKCTDGFMCHGLLCVPEAETDESWCRRKCELLADPSCPGACWPFGGQDSYCDCRDCSFE